VGHVRVGLGHEKREVSRAWREEGDGPANGGRADRAEKTEYA